MGLNGMLAGLVGITAGAGAITPWGAVIVGAIAGTIVVISVLIFDKLKIDDPVGASIRSRCLRYLGNPRSRHLRQRRACR